MGLIGKIRMDEVYVCTWLEKRIITVLKSLLRGSMSGSVLRVLGRDVKIQGSVSLKFYVGGETLVSDIVYYGDVYIDPPLITWSDVDSLLKAFPFFVLTSIVFTLGYLFSKMTKAGGRGFHGSD